MERIYSYPPVVDASCRRLVLGTMPSVQSLRDGFYYAHPRNAFWRILSDCFGEELPRTVEEKTALLLRRRLALWDTAHSCVRRGSLDADMREVRLNDFCGLMRAYPRLERVLLNGQEAARLYRRGGGDLQRAIVLPSTSPAYTLPYEEKLARWRAALEEEVR